MWSYLVSKCTIALGAMAFTLVDLFWAHQVAALVFLAALATIAAVAWLEMLKPAPKRIEPYLGPVGLRLRR